MNSVSLWSRRDPLAEFDDGFAALVRRTFGPSRPTHRTLRPDRPTGFVPAAELGRDGADAVLSPELPGLDVAKDVTVEIANGRLVVAGAGYDAGVLTVRVSGAYVVPESSSQRIPVAVGPAAERPGSAAEQVESESQDPGTAEEQRGRRTSKR